MNCEEIPNKTIASYILGTLALGLMFSITFSSKAVAIFRGSDLDVAVTFQKTVEGFLYEQGLNLNTFDRVLVKPSGFVVEDLMQPVKSGMKLEFEKAEPISVLSDNVRRQIYATKKTLRKIVSRLGIKLSPLDRVQLSEDPLNPGKLMSRVVRVEHKYVKRQERIPYEIDYVPNNQVYQGKVVVWKLGSGGEREDTYREVYEDGKIVSSTFVSTRISHRPVHEEIAIGDSEVPGSALAVYNMDSTAYSPTVEECDGDPWTTATGMRSGYGIVAVDPTAIPYFTKMYIEGYGYAIAGDCGGAIKQNRIDVFFYKTDEAKRWGRKNVKVYILEWPDKNR